jgi:hypothetical protein
MSSVLYVDDEPSLRIFGSASSALLGAHRRGGAGRRARRRPSRWPVGQKMPGLTGVEFWRAREDH